jgi:hypothetical protein
MLTPLNNAIFALKPNWFLEEQQLIAFNWRNTMHLEAKENLKKNNRLDTLQIEQHYKKLSDYHKEKNIDFPQVFIDLFARHLDAGNPLEPLLLPEFGNK